MAAPSSYNRSLPELLKGLVEGTVADVTVSGLALDSRQLGSGGLFIALCGVNQKGHDFIPAAIKAGAAAVVYDAAVSLPATDDGVPLIPVRDLAHKTGVIAERFFEHPSRQLTVIGVTGTNGKTSCSQFLAQALDRPGSPCAVIGTLGNGLWGRLDTATHTTPDAVTLHALLRSLADDGATTLAMEVSSHALDQGRVAGVEFDVAVFTNLSRDHLDYHGDMDQYGQAKARLFRQPGLGCAVINGDDPHGRRLAAELPKGVDLYIYSMAGQAAVGHGRPISGELLRLDQQGLELKVSTPAGEGVLRSHLLGAFNASNLLAVLCVLLSRGMALDEALQRLAGVDTVAGRMEGFGGGEGRPLVVVDYAHTPDALEQVLTSLRGHCRGLLWCVVGCGGDRDKGKRPMMGGLAEQLADRVILTADNPRSEDNKAIVADMQAGMERPEAVQVIHDRAEAIAYAIRQAAANDLVLVAGKGHETYQQIGQEKRPFSDREQVRSVLEAA